MSELREHVARSRAHWDALARQFAEATPVRPWVRTGRLQRRLSQAAGADWAMLPHVAGFLAKDTPIDGVVLAVRAAANGVAWLSPRAAEVVLGRVRRGDADEEPEADLIDELSSREREVLRLIARGLENAEIATELGISPRTAKNHVSNILAKLGLPSRIQAAIYAVRRGLN